MKVIIDTRLDGLYGIGTYLRNLLPHLGPFDALDSKAPIYTIHEQFDFVRKIPSCDAFWSPHFNTALLPIRAKRHVVTIHDLYHIEAGQFFAKAVLGRVVRHVDQIITVSEFSKSRLLHYFPEAEGKVTVIHSGGDHLLSVKPVPVEDVPSQFYLFVGNRKTHKNYAFAQECVNKVGGNLVAVGQGFRSVSEGELVWLYKHAHGLIFPSLYEGFGLPPLEAMSLGCPVWASDIAPVREVCGNAVHYLNPSTILGEGESLIEQGKRRAAQFSWEESGRKHAHLLRGAPLCNEKALL